MHDGILRLEFVGERSEFGDFGVGLTQLVLRQTVIGSQTVSETDKQR